MEQDITHNTTHNTKNIDEADEKYDESPQRLPLTKPAIRFDNSINQKKRRDGYCLSCKIF